MSNSTSFQFTCPQLISIPDIIFSSPAGSTANRHFRFAYKGHMNGFSVVTGEYHVNI